MFSFASLVSLTYGVEWCAAVAAHGGVVWILSATFTTVNHNSPSISFSFDSVLRLAVARKSIWVGCPIAFVRVREDSVFGISYSETSFFMSCFSCLARVDS